ncbi:MAG: hypothetical protein ACJAUD_000129 [Crocinitomicaceae bacterium]|jgi:hypothetical protein
MKLAVLILGTIVLNSFSSVAQLWDHTEPSRLGGTSNTDIAEESIPIFSNDSSMLYFVRSNSNENKGGTNDFDIWSSKLDEEGVYSDSRNVKELNNKFNNTVVGVSKTGQSIYLLNSYEGKKDQIKGLSVSKKNNGKWSKPEAIEIPSLDIDGEFYSFHVSEDEKTIIISYDGSNSLGDEDLYASTKSGGIWSAPVHMGSKINSIGFEISPFLSSNQDTLFFSSNGFGGEGDADIFYSVKQGSWTEWSAPMNLGNVINTSKFDAYFSHNGHQAFWSSNRESELSDIYTINILSPVPVFVACEGTDASAFGTSDGHIDADVTGGSAPFAYEWSNGESMEDLSGLSKGVYSLTVTDSKGQAATTECAINHPAKPLKLYEDLEFIHNFAYNKTKLSTKNGELKDFVGKIDTQLKNGREKIAIQIVSSASQVPTKTFVTNDKLADARAEQIKEVLMKYYANNSSVEIVILESTVNGPSYEDDSTNQVKYAKHQFISLKTK